MTLSIGLSVNPQDPQWLELAREAERVGVDSIWVPEFWAYDAFTPLAAIAVRTQRVRLATGIAQLGALQLWANSRRNRAEALGQYHRALALGGSRPLPELFSAAGCRFEFSAKTIQPLAKMLRDELGKL